MYIHKYIPSHGWEIWFEDQNQEYHIAVMRWTDGLNPDVEKAVEQDARRIVACLNFCQGMLTGDIERIVANKNEHTKAPDR